MIILHVGWGVNGTAVLLGWRKSHPGLVHVYEEQEWVPRIVAPKQQAWQGTRISLRESPRPDSRM